MNNQFTLHHGDCLESMHGMADNSVDSVVCDPPYGLSDHAEKDIRACMAAWLNGDEYLHGKKGFMNKTWDSFVPGPEVWREVFRVLKPGGYVLAFASTRTDDLMSMAMRLAGFRKHPFIGWIFGSGFPKAANLSKAFDREAGVDRDVVGVAGKSGSSRSCMAGDFAGGEYMQTSSSTAAAKQWDGWAYGLQSLKPAIEPCLMFQKPHQGRMTDNVLQWGTGAINVDGCRVGSEGGCAGAGAGAGAVVFGNGLNGTFAQPVPGLGRWPANLIHDGSDCVVAGFPVTAGAVGMTKHASGTNSVYGNFSRTEKSTGGLGAKDTGSAARFFKQVSPEAEDLDAARFMYCAKASRRDRDEGLDGFDAVSTIRYREQGQGPDVKQTPRKPVEQRNTHMCVKPTDLMAYLCRLVTPSGGTILDPFCGSGSTGKAAMREGFRFIGCELDPEYIAIARARIQHEVNKIEASRVMADAAAAPTPQFDLFAAR